MMGNTRGAIVTSLVALTLVAPAGWLPAQQTEAPTAIAERPAAAVPAPADVFGFQPGDDYKIADYAQMLDFYRQLDEASDRVQMAQIGESVQGKPLLLLFISSEENLAQLDRWKEISARLARARGLTDDEARQLAEEGKSIVWIDGGMHASEKAHAQMTPLLAYRVATEESEEMREIRDKTVLLLMPVMNPDGLDIVAHWYQRQLGTPFETTQPPELYHTYVGHDNNRDWYMLLQPESRAVARVLYNEWYPQIVYNHHQTSPDWTRIFIPPFADPVNPNIQPGVITGVNLVGQAMHERFAEKEMPGAISRLTFDMWWNGGMRTTPYYHNMIGILTETAHPSPTPKFYDPDSIPATVGGRRVGATPTAVPSIFYPDPWKGGWSRFGDAVNYMLEASMAVLDLAAERKEDWLFNMYRMASDAVEAGEAGGPFAYVISPDQWDPGEAVNLVNVLRRGGVEVHRATQPFSAEGNQFPAGSYVIPAAQAFRPHVVDLLERQVYPHREMYAGGPPEPPYDLSGWTLPIQMGVDVTRIEQPTDLPTQPIDSATVEPGQVTGDASFGWLLSARPNASVLATNRLLAEGARVHRAAASVTVAGEEYDAGAFIVEAGSGTGDQVASLARELGIDFVGLAERPGVSLIALEQPRIGLYKSWVPNMDEGWTRWLLERYEFPVDTLHDADIRSGDLSRYHAIILPDQDPETLLDGHEAGSMPDDYVGGLEAEGAAALQRYVEGGGRLIALDAAADFAIEQFDLPVRDAVAEVPSEQFFIPGSLIAVDVDATDPGAWGMRPEAAAFFVRSRAFDVADGAPNADVIARYAGDNLLLSGWELGANDFLAGKPAAVRVGVGDGEVVLIGFRPQFRGQPRATYKLLFNPLLHATGQEN